jgi:hypothetical protein
MKRELVDLKKISYWGGCHTLNPDGSFSVREKGKGLKDHLDGIKFFKQLIIDGINIIPPLVERKPDGSFNKLDGFKRIKAYNELGIEKIEVFVCEPKDRGKSFTFNGKNMICKPGGQTYKVFKDPKEYEGDIK